MSAWANVATLGKAKNLKGGLLAYSREGLPFLLEEGMEVTFVPPVLSTPRTGRVVEIFPQAGGAYLVFFDSIDSIDLAERLQDHYVLVRKADLPEDYDKTLFDLVGFKLLDPEGACLGEVSALEENPAHPLLVLLRADAEDLVRIPFVEDFIVAIDPDERLITMDLPEGLLEI